MKTALLSLAAASTAIAPASTQASDDRPRYEHRDHQKYDRRQRADRPRWTFQVRVGTDRYDRRQRSRFDRMCSRRFDSFLTVRGFRNYRGRIMVNGRRYRPDHGICVSNLRRGDFVYQDLNGNRRFDRFEPYGYAERDRWFGRSGYTGNAYYTVDLR